jgi:hypothetical protein
MAITDILSNSPLNQEQCQPNRQVGRNAVADRPADEEPT